jgi:thiamine biosynthesis protein ThiS
MSNIVSTTTQITVNGQPRAVAENSCVSDLMAELALDARKVAVELNRTIVPRSEYAATTLRDGDAVEIVSFIGGG